MLYKKLLSINFFSFLFIFMFLFSCNESTSPKDTAGAEDFTTDHMIEEIPLESNEIADFPLIDSIELQESIDTTAELEDIPIDLQDILDIHDGEAGCINDSECSGGKCCNGRCVNPLYDPQNCGGCGSSCPPQNPFCNGGSCGPTPCSVVCTATQKCCGSNCCELNQICCIVERGGPVSGPECFDDYCPLGCPLCL